MRLLNTVSLELRFFMPEHAPDYVILSHRWTAEEVIFDDFAVGSLASPNHHARCKIGFEKVLGACRKAVADKYDWIWIDSCCIDKSSSAVLQESINSMWQYYANANICYVYMPDVPSQAAGWTSLFTESEWFDRGWTLQELIAPRLVEFYSRDWSAIGTKIQRCDELVTRTHIDRDVLLNPALVESNSAANRMSWAAHRQVTREEDQAYCLLGLFQVAMPMLYGEGAAKAFGRLQEAIYNSSRDDSLFLFRYNLHPERMPLLAESPTQFCPRAVCQPCNSHGSVCLLPELELDQIVESSSWSLQAHEHLLTTITPQRFEASTTLLLLDKAAIPRGLLQKSTAKTVKDATHVAILNHTLGQYRDGAICLFLRQYPDWGYATVRMEAYPLILPHWKSVVTKATEKKVLFATTISSNEEDTPVTMDFLVRASMLYASQWDAEGSSFELTCSQSDVDAGYHCSMRSSKLSNQPTQLTCHLSSTTDPGFKLVLLLQRDHSMWLISDALISGSRRRNKDSRRNRLQDRCTVQMATGVNILISVRRLPGARLRQSGNGEAIVRTQIRITPS